MGCTHRSWGQALLPGSDLCSMLQSLLHDEVDWQKLAGTPGMNTPVPPSVSPNTACLGLQSVPAHVGARVVTHFLPLPRPLPPRLDLCFLGDDSGEEVGDAPNRSMPASTAVLTLASRAAACCCCWRASTRRNASASPLEMLGTHSGLCREVAWQAGSGPAGDG